jgi:pyruvate kinase
MPIHSKSQIIATIGPACREKHTLKAMIEHQMDAARLNFSWGTHKEHAAYISAVRSAAAELGKHVPIILDLSGPRIQKGGGHEFNESVREPLTEKDLDDLKFGLEQGVEYVAMSYVGDGGDVSFLREKMKALGKIIPIIAKIERKSALDHIDEIIAVADVVMVARGDLGNEVPLEEIPFIEKTIISKCKEAGKPVITATQMMLSMTEHDSPTRAEVTDVAFAIMSGSDAVMLSEETAIGKYPVEAVEMMEKIIMEAEKNSYGKINPLR